jgi:hypothetical protein
LRASILKRSTPHRAGRTAALLAALGVILGGCGSMSVPAPTFSKLFNSMKPQPEPNASALAQPDFECPSVTIRQGASTYTVSANPKEPTPLNLRYQVSIGDTARECRLVAGVVTMRVGVEGRLVLGPAGGPGTVEVPLRFAVVLETGTESKTIVTKLERVPVAIQENQPHVLFTQVEDGLSFPMPRGGLIDSYVLYVGFDPLGAHELKKQRPPVRKKTPKLRRSTT